MTQRRTGIERIFVGDDGPLAAKVCEVLLPGAVEGLADLGDWLVVAPTRQAGRRLREELARRCAESESALLPPWVVTPAHFLRVESGGGDVATESLAVGVWVEVLLHELGRGEFASLFPVRPAPGDYGWALHTGTMLHRLRRALAEGGLLIADIPEAAGESIPEPARWRDLSSLEERYLARIQGLGARDPCQAQILACLDPELPPEVERILVAGVPDPAPILTRAWRHLSTRLPVDVLIHAPASDADLFDEWGRPRAEAWASEVLDIPDPEHRIILAGAEADQSRAAVDLVREVGGRGSVVGVPDRSVAPYLINELEEAGFQAFHPAPGAVSDHRVYRLLRAWRDLTARRDYHALRDFLRHADALRALMPADRMEAASLLEQLDRCRSEHLPATVEAVHRRARGRSDGTGPYPVVARVLDELAGWMEGFQRLPPADAVAAFLSRVYAGVELAPARPEDREFTAAAAEVRAALSELRDSRFESLGMPTDVAMELLLLRIRDAPTRPDPGPGDIELEGWLELPWNDAAQVVITGMNEGVVPESRCSDPFLPNTLRAQLGLRTVEERFARDAFLLRGLIESRRRDGRVMLIVGRSTRDGDVLRPSRLLFRCRDQDLPARAESLFAEPLRRSIRAHAGVSFPLRSAPPRGVEPTVNTLHVTAFRDYLGCPFRFYLRRVLGMEPLDDRKTEMDALDFGNLVHHALEQGIKRGAHLDGAEPMAGVLESIATGWALERYGSPLPLPVEIQLRAAVQRLGAAARIQQELVRQGWETVATEHRLEATIGGIRVVGKIDRIDRRLDTGLLRVLDYKTSERVEPPRKAHLRDGRREAQPYAVGSAAGKTVTWTNLQLPLYRMLLEHEGHFTGPMELAYFNLPRAVQESGVLTWDDFDEEAFASAMHCASGVIADVAAQRFWPPAERVEYDDFAGLFTGEPSLCFVPPDAGARA